MTLVAFASAAHSQSVQDDRFALHQILSVPPPNSRLRLDIQPPRTVYSGPTIWDRWQSVAAGIQVAPGTSVGLGISDRRRRRSTLTPDPRFDPARRSKKLAVAMNLKF
jgi:hypothetical protein